MDTNTPPIGRVAVLVKDQYGQQVYHPNNLTANLLADIAGTKTLTVKTLKAAMLLGYEITYEREGVTL